MLLGRYQETSEPLQYHESWIAHKVSIVGIHRDIWADSKQETAGCGRYFLLLQSYVPLRLWSLPKGQEAKEDMIILVESLEVNATVVFHL